MSPLVGGVRTVWEPQDTYAIQVAVRPTLAYSTCSMSRERVVYVHS